MTEEFAATCDWCHIEVISFVQPPAMVEVTTEVRTIQHRSFARICAECHVELVKLIAARDWASRAPDRV